jgi:predicted unusual protein kinase regulating ubiquinone biosynthesis (AarF/ABC1/UbiB family)
MVSEWIEGIKVTDGEKLKALNFNQKQIMTDIIRAFA